MSEGQLARADRSRIPDAFLVGQVGLCSRSHPFFYLFLFIIFKKCKVSYFPLCCPRRGMVKVAETDANVETGAVCRARKEEVWLWFVKR